MVQNGQDLQILCGNALMARGTNLFSWFFAGIYSRETPPKALSGSVAEMLGAVREVKSYLVCHQLCRQLGWYSGTGRRETHKTIAPCHLFLKRLSRIEELQFVSSWSTAYRTLQSVCKDEQHFMRLQRYVIN